ncbi:MAG: hypothetical protein LQ348_001811 [Seirophora lacunosa]|nr:MAG: hypothetical protein LQ348_001811 [Seirophora lacunosa]
MAPPERTFQEKRVFEVNLNLLEVLTEEALYILERMPRSRLSPAQCGVLYRINSHFNGNEPPAIDNAAASVPVASHRHHKVIMISDDSDNDDGGQHQEQQELQQQQQQHQQHQQHHLLGNRADLGHPTAQSWGLILEKKDFPLPDELREIVPPSLSFDIAGYLGSPSTWEHVPTAKDLPTVSGLIWSMPSRTSNERVCRLFQFLALAKIVSRLFGQVWSQSNERRKRGIIGKYNEKAWKMIEGPLNVIKGLIFLCEELGKGCIFWLNQELTDNFLAKRITRSGTSYDRAIALLRKHDLVQTMRQSGANELAKRIESHLVNVYRISEIHQEAMHTFDDGVTIKRSDEDIEDTNDGDRMHLDD